MLPWFSPSWGDPSPKHSSPHPRAANPGCAAAIPHTRRARRGILWHLVPVETRFAEPSAGKPASEGAPPPGARTWPSSTGGHCGAGSHWDRRKGFSILLQGRYEYYLEQLRAVRGKCWVAACVDLSGENEAVGLVILPKSHKMQIFPESQVHSRLFSETCPSLETRYVWTGAACHGPDKLLSRLHPPSFIVTDVAHLLREAL